MATLLVHILATWRVTSLLLGEDGPFRIFARLRARIGVDEPGEITGLRQLFSCPYCMSVWVAALWFIGFVVRPAVAVPLAGIAAASAGAIGLAKFLGKD